MNLQKQESFPQPLKKSKQVPWDYTPRSHFKALAPRWDYSPFLEEENFFKMTPQEIVKEKCMGHKTAADSKSIGWRKLEV